MYASVNSECIGCGSCEALCPEVFRMNSNDLAEAYKNPVPQDAERTAKEAATTCPVSAITLD